MKAALDLHLSAVNDRHEGSALPESGGQAVGPRRTRGVKGNRYRTGLRADIDRRLHLIQMEHPQWGGTKAAR
jgi:hypothetical protein